MGGVSLSHADPGDRAPYSELQVSGLFTIRKREGGIFYEELVWADSWEDAEAQAELMDGEVTGRVNVERPEIEDEYYQ